jgi:hypothetical protein
MKAQENNKEKEKKMIKNEIKLGDVVVWNFVFDVWEEKGVVVCVDGDNVSVEYVGWNGKVYRDVLSMDEIMLESEYNSQDSF